jgi:exosortase/archaeosortase family protein
MKVLVRFAVYSAVLLLGWALLRDEQSGRFFVAHAVITPASWIAGLLGNTAVWVEGVTIRVPGASINVRPGCEGMELPLMTAAGLLAWPAGWAHRVRGVIAICMLLLLANQVRLAVLMRAIEYDRGWFEFIHSTGGPILLASMAVGFFMLWTRRASMDASGCA